MKIDKELNEKRFFSLKLQVGIRYDTTGFR